MLFFGLHSVTVSEYFSKKYTKIYSIYIIATMVKSVSLNTVLDIVVIFRNLTTMVMVELVHIIIIIIYVSNRTYRTNRTIVFQRTRFFFSFIAVVFTVLPLFNDVRNLSMDAVTSLRVWNENAIQNIEKIELYNYIHCTIHAQPSPHG